MSPCDVGRSHRAQIQQRASEEAPPILTQPAASACGPALLSLHVVQLYFCRLHHIDRWCNTASRTANLGTHCSPDWPAPPTRPPHKHNSPYARLPTPSPLQYCSLYARLANDALSHPINCCSVPPAITHTLPCSLQLHRTPSAAH